MAKKSTSNKCSYEIDDKPLKLKVHGRPRLVFASEQAKQEHRQQQRKAQNKRYKLSLYNDPSRADVLAKLKATKEKCEAKRYGDYTVISQRIKAVYQELRAMYELLSPEVKLSGELKTLWDNRVRKEPILTSVCASYK